MTRCAAVDDLQCSLSRDHSGDHCDVVGHRWPQAPGEARAPVDLFPGWPDDAPAVYVDEYGEHGWDELTYDADDELAEPMTYRELAYDLAAARGLSIASFLDRQHLRHSDDEKMSPPWVDDEG